MGHVKTLGPGHGQSGLEDDVLAGHDHFSDGPHVFNMVEEVETAHHLVVIADHFPGLAHQVARLGRIAQHVGGAHQQLLERLGGEAVPLAGFGEGIGHIGHHGHMEVSAAAILNGEIAHIVQVRTDEPVLGQAEAVAGIGLGEVARRGVRKVHVAGIPNEIQGRQPVALRVGRGLSPGGRADGRQHRLEGAETGRGGRTVFPELHIGIEALGRNFSHQPGQALPFRGQIRIEHQLGMVGDEIGIDVALAEQRILDDLAEERNRGLDAADDVFAQSAVHDAQGLFPVMGVGDQERARGIIVGRKLIASADIGVQAHTQAAGRNITRDQAGVGREVVLRIFAIDTHLHGAVGRPQVFLAVAQLGAESHGDLLFHQVDAVAALGDAVFHLQTGIHFNQIRRTLGRNQKFHRGQRMVSHGAHQAAGIILEALTQLAGYTRPGRRRDFDQLLMVALHGAVAFIKGEDIAVHVGDDLDFNVAHAAQKFFHKKTRVAERGLGHGRGLEKGVFQLGFVMNGENAPAAAAALGLEHDGQADLADQTAGRGNIHRSVGTGHHGNAQFTGHLARLDLVAQEVHGLGRGADKGNTGFLAALRKARILGGEAPAGMDAHHAALLGHVDDSVDVQIRARLAAQQHQFLGRGGGRSGLVHVCGGHGRHRVKALPDGTANAPGRNAPVRHQNDLALQKILHFRECLVGHAFSALYDNLSESRRLPLNHSSQRPLRNRRSPPAGVRPSSLPRTLRPPSISSTSLPRQSSNCSARVFHCSEREWPLLYAECTCFTSRCHSSSARGAGRPGTGCRSKLAARRAASARNALSGGAKDTLTPMPASSTPPRSSNRMPASLRGPSGRESTRSLGHLSSTGQPSARRAQASSRPVAGAAAVPSKGGSEGRRRAA